MDCRETDDTLGTLVGSGGRGEQRNFTWERVVKGQKNTELGAREHIRTHRRLPLRYFVDISKNIRSIRMKFVRNPVL